MAAAQNEAVAHVMAALPKLLNVPRSFIDGWVQPPGGGGVVLLVHTA